MPKAIAKARSVPDVGRKAPEDKEIEERVRAHVRRRMEFLNLGVTQAAEMCDCDQGNLTKILLVQRGMGLGMAVRLITGLGLDALTALTVDPDQRFFSAYVPRSKDEDHPGPHATRNRDRR